MAKSNEIVTINEAFLADVRVIFGDSALASAKSDVDAHPSPSSRSNREWVKRPAKEMTEWHSWKDY